ncbi:MAG: hypothetical protein BroJett018_38220 [Chloroflexota bacterium]|nr:MAG: hypothetical protein BroJett018_38220 [Chloroflexota bacterium]
MARSGCTADLAFELSGRPYTHKKGAVWWSRRQSLKFQSSLFTIRVVQNWGNYNLLKADGQGRDARKPCYNAEITG